MRTKQVSVALLIVFMLLLPLESSCSSCGILQNIAQKKLSPTPAPFEVPKGLEKIKHFVFIMQENRSFDSYFGTYPGADGIPPGVSLPDPAGGPPVSPFHDPYNINRGGPHGWDAAWNDIDGGKWMVSLNSLLR